MAEAAGRRPRPARRLAELRARYLRELPARVGALAECARRVGLQPHRTSVEAVYLLSHKLAGSSAIYGCHAVSGPAVLLETLLREVLDGERPLARRVERELEELITELEQAVLSETGSAPMRRV